MAIGIISNLYMHKNGIHGKADIQLYARMLRELLEEKGVKHVIVNGNVSNQRLQLMHFQEAVLAQFGSRIQYHYTNGKEDVAVGNGMTVAEYIKGETEDPYHLKNSPIVWGRQVVVGMDTLCDFSFYNHDLSPENQLNEWTERDLMEEANLLLFDDYLTNETAIREVSEACITEAERKIKCYPGWDVTFVTPAMPKQAFALPNGYQDPRVARKNAMMGTDKIGAMLERNGVNRCYFSQTPRRLSGSINGTAYHAQPVGRKEEWGQFTVEQTLTNGMRVFTQQEAAHAERLLREYQPSEAVLNLHLQTEATLQLIA